MQLAEAEIALEENPGDADALTEQATYIQAVADAQELLESLRSTYAPASPPPEPEDVEEQPPEFSNEPTPDDVPPPPPSTAVDTENAPSPPPPESAIANATEALDQAKTGPVVYHFNPGDTVLARWSEDHKFYNATVLTKSGSSANPVYYVKFKDYAEHASVSGKDIRPTYREANAAKKRKAEEAVNDTTAEPTHSSAAVITAAPTYYKAEESVKKQKPDDKPKGTGSKAYKKMDSKGLEKQRSSWQDWQNNSKWAKKNKKDSMFRVGEGHKARVGFVGSGKEMTRTEQRKRTDRDKDKEALRETYEADEYD